MELGFLIRSHLNLREWATFADSIEIPHIEINYMGSGPYQFDAAALNKAMEGKRSKLSVMSLWHINTIAKDPEQRKASRAMITDFLQATAEVKAPMAFMNMGTYEEGNTQKNIEEFIKEHEYYQAMAQDLGFTLAYYLGHKGNFINSPEILDQVVEAIPDINLKLDPVGLQRNVKADPYEVVKKHGERIKHFHCKEVLRLEGYEIEPPVGMGDIRWNNLLAMLYHVQYSGMIIIEPHGPMWGDPELARDHIILSKRHLEQFIL